ncbi:MAG: hypothetical protein BRC29_02190 [Nanohaloarchaea archaeon SW_7_43_1]|nr:MAG: hypothetical protein BRC29_02190 [Nanohaloarchaea archaeon SW_7_43_1]
MKYSRALPLLAILLISTTPLGAANDYIIQDSGENPLFAVNESGEKQVYNGELDLNGNNVTSVGGLELGWENLTDYPSGCGSNEAVRVIGDTIGCTSLNPGGTVETGGGSKGQVAYFIDSENITGSDNFYWNNSEIELGIGTNTPSAALDVNGDVKINDGLDMASSDITGINDLGGTGIVDNNQLSDGAVTSSKIGGQEVTSNKLNTGVAGTGLSGGGGSSLSVNTDTGLTTSGDSVLINTAVVPRKGEDETITASQWVYENDVQVQGNLDVWGNITNTDVENLNINGSLLPPSGYSDTFDIGSPSRRWKTGYFQDMELGNNVIDNSELANTGFSTDTNSGIDSGSVNLGGELTINHSDTSSVSDSDTTNSDGQVLQDLTFDGFGHVQTQSTKDLDNRYYTEAESDENFVDESGDTMTGTLNLNQGGTNLALKPGSTDHSYMEFYADSDNPGTRSGWIGYGSGGSDQLRIKNQMGGNLILDPGTDEVSVAGNLKMNSNSINGFFGGNCQSDEVVKKVNSDGTYNCQSITGASDDTYVNEGGDTMTGNLNMSGDNIQNVGTINASQLEKNGNTVTSLFLDISGDAMSGQINMQGNPVTNVETIDMNQSGQIQTDSTNAVSIDSNQNVEISNGDLNLGDNQLTNVGGTDCDADETLLGDGSCGTTGGNLSETLKAGNEAGNTDINLTGQQILDTTGSVTLGGGNVDIPDGELDVGSPSNTGSVLDVGGDLRTEGAMRIDNPGANDFLTVSGSNIDPHTLRFDDRSFRIYSGDNAEAGLRIDNETANIDTSGNNLTDTQKGNVTIGQDLKVYGDIWAPGTGGSGGSGGSGETENLSETLTAGNVANRTIEFGEDTNVEIGRNTATNEESLAIGKGAQADGTDAVGYPGNETAVGTDAAATGTRSSAFGASAEATGIGSTAIGEGASATSTRQTTAIGGDSSATASFATAIGYFADASGYQATATGEQSEASALDATATGYVADATAQESTTTGAYAEATAFGATATGHNADASANSSTATGSEAVASGKGSIALGGDLQNGDITGAEAEKEASVAIGPNAVAPNSYEATFGNLDGQELDVNITGNLTVHGDDFIEPGPNTNIEIGRNTETNNESLAIGKGALANGSDDGFGNFGNETAVGTGAVATGVISSAFGASAEATGQSAIATGSYTVASDSEATATGYFVNATAIRATATGSRADATARRATATGAFAEASGSDAIATGSQAEATISNSIATGNQARASAYGATATGYYADAAGQGSVALGSDLGGDPFIGANASQRASIAIGPDAVASKPGSVAIGNGSKAEHDDTVTLGDRDGTAYDLRVTGNIYTDGGDLAEFYQSPQDLEAAEVVKISEERDNRAVRTDEKFEEKVFGVVSSDPGQIMNTEEEEEGHAIALEGKVPVKLKEGVSVDRGDRIAPSKVEGKATTCKVIDPEENKEMDLREIISHNQKCESSTVGRSLEKAEDTDEVLVKLE